MGLNPTRRDITLHGFKLYRKKLFLRLASVFGSLYSRHLIDVKSIEDEDLHVIYMHHE